MTVKTAHLTPAEINIIFNKGTEYPFSGNYDKQETPGTYLCKQCGLALFRADSKFPAGCGWPAFDCSITGNVLEQVDADGRRTEILCSRCNAHLGHVFQGEGYTPKNTRHCVNSISLEFVDDLTISDTEEAIVAAGCFWGVEYYFQKLPGVVKTEVGYTGGQLLNPSYEKICSQPTGHVEAVRIIYNPSIINYQDIIKYFFEIHDPSQTDGQGPDRGAQYLSRIFAYDNAQQTIALDVIKQLQSKHISVATQVLTVSTFWRAETYHQLYYSKNGKQPYCHSYTKRF